MSDKTIEGDILARIRTLLALERNYLAEERTQLAKLRTGLAFVLIVPPIYFFSISLQINVPLMVVILIYLFLAFSAFWGVWMVAKSRSELKIIRLKMIKVKDAISKIIKSSESASDLLGNFFFF